MEDSVFIHPHREEKLTTSAEAVRRVAAIASELGREIATPAEAREILGITRKTAKAAAAE
jgi:3-keto-5-aminohexanoate cleavage enzyme